VLAGRWEPTMDKSIRLLALVATLLVFFGPGALADPQPGAPVVLTLSVIDVGQGDSVLVSTSDGYNMLVDGGSRSAADEVLEHLEASNVDQIDVLICTHPHEDHIGGLAAVLDNIAVGRVLESGLPADTQTYRGLHDRIMEKALPLSAARAGDTFALGPATVKILWPTGWLMPGNLNDCSVVARVIYGRFSALLTGDAEADVERALITGRWLSPTVVLKVAHHGSSTSSTAEFLDAVDPEIAIISVGTDNSYGHPDTDVIARLKAYAVETYRTDLNGTVSMRTDGDTWRVYVEREAAASAEDAVSDPKNTAPQAYCGSRRSNVFHYLWCKSVASIAPANVITFGSRQEAIERGYRPCSVCMP
jgi:competence protein ComEC